MAQALNEDLNQRVNLEQSRNFSRTVLAERLQKFSNIATVCLQKWPQQQTQQQTQQQKDTPISEAWLEKNLIHVVGSNGKGSVSHYLSQFASSSLQPIGKYTSPHLLSPLERIQIRCDDRDATGSEYTNNQRGDGDADSDGGGAMDPTSRSYCIATHNNYIRLAETFEIWQAIRKMLPAESYWQLSYFEIWTLVALLFFSQRQCGLQIFEAGIGGRFDATKVLNGSIVVTTCITLDHTRLLGSSKKDILNEKLAIAGAKCRHLFYMADADICSSWIHEHPNIKNKNIDIYRYEYSECHKSHDCAESQDARDARDARDANESQHNDYLNENAQYAKFILQTLNLLETRPEPLASSYLTRPEQMTRPLGHLETHMLDHPEPQVQVQSQRKHPKHKQSPKKIHFIFDVAHNLAAISRSCQDLLGQGIPADAATKCILGLLPPKPPQQTDNGKTDADEPFRNIERCSAHIQSLGIRNVEFPPKEYFAAQEKIPHLHDSLDHQAIPNSLDHQAVPSDATLQWIDALVSPSPSSSPSSSSSPFLEQWLRELFAWLELPESRYVIFLGSHRLYALYQITKWRWQNRSTSGGLADPSATSKSKKATSKSKKATSESKRATSESKRAT